ncbi:hypothetical protein D3C81_2173880 [compost metagenome]
MALSTTRKTITAAISIGLPSTSLTFNFTLLKLRTRRDTFFRPEKGTVSQMPLSRMVPL